MTNKVLTFFTPILMAGTLHAAPLALSGTWYAIDQSGVNSVNLTGDADTISVQQPSGAGGTTRRGGVTALSSEVSLDDVGDFIQFSGDYSGDIGNNVNYAIRIGFYNDNNSPVTADFSTASNGWSGLFTGLGNRSTNGAKSNNFYQPVNGDEVMDLNDSNPDTAIGGTASDISSGDRNVTFRIERTSETNLSLQLISGSVNHTDTLAVATAPTTTFDSLAVAFNLGNNTNSRSAEFDNIAVTAIPEPGTLALVGLALSTILMFRRGAK